MAEVTPLTLDDYDAIADAVQETERGRWFLAEYARRNRAADTAAVLDALAGLEHRLSLQAPTRRRLWFWSMRRSNMRIWPARLRPARRLGGSTS